LRFKKTPVIIYPNLGLEEVFNRTQKNCIEDYIQELYDKNDSISSELGEYNILIVWNEGKNRMVDLWIFDKIESWGSGPLVDVKIFRDQKFETNIGVSAGNGLVMLGREEELRRSKTTLNDYINGERPVLPKGINPTESFYQ